MRPVTSPISSKGARRDVWPSHAKREAIPFGKSPQQFAHRRFLQSDTQIDGRLSTRGVATTSYKLAPQFQAI